MAADDSQSNDNDDIRTSVFFESSITTAFLNVTIADERFPQEALSQIMRPDPVLNLPSSPPLATIDAQQKEALSDVIKALGTHLAVPSVDRESAEGLQHRVVLGFCRLLMGQFKQAESEFDVVRLSTRKRQEDKDLSNLQTLTLWGAEVAAREQMKEANASRFRRWRTEALKRA